MIEHGWRKSSYSQPNGACVELRWRKASYSHPNGECVEFAQTLDRVRDSKNPGPVLAVGLSAFVAGIKVGRFDR